MIKSPQVLENRKRFLDVLRSGKYPKGTIKSDDKGYPIIESKEDEDGYCACAIMIHEFPDENGKESILNARKALGLKLSDCRFIQQEINDTPLTFVEMADHIEEKVFC